MAGVADVWKKTSTKLHTGGVVAVRCCICCPSRLPFQFYLLVCSSSALNLYLILSYLNASRRHRILCLSLVSEEGLEGFSPMEKGVRRPK